jgi:hypothetical protein
MPKIDLRLEKAAETNKACVVKKNRKIILLLNM